MSEDVTLGELYRLAKDTNERVLRIEGALFIGNGEPAVLSRLTALESSQRRTVINASGIASIIAAIVTGVLAWFSEPHK